jgi:hypothetical protein
MPKALAAFVARSRPDHHRYRGGQVRDRHDKTGYADRKAHGLHNLRNPEKLYSGTAHGFSQPKNKAEERAITQANATTGRTLKELFGV